MFINYILSQRFLLNFNVNPLLAPYHTKHFKDVSDVLKDLKAFILNENGIDGGPLVINNVPYNPLTFYDNANEQVQLSKFWMDIMRVHRDENKLATTYQLRLQHEEAEEEQTVDLHGVYTQVSPIFNVYININVCEYVCMYICVCCSL